MICDVGDVAVAVFPYVDMGVLKPRPVLVLTDAARNRRVGETTMAMITTASRSRWDDDLALRDWMQAGLRTPCFVRTRISSIVNGLISARIGRISDGDRLRAARTVRGVIVL